MTSRCFALLEKLSALLLLAALLWVGGCTERKYSNPLDPRNPETGGRPTGLRVYSIRDSVFLRWRPLHLTGLRAFRIWRARAGGDFELVAEVEPASERFVDPGLRFGERYRYYITVLGQDFETPPSDTVSIVPGPTSILVSDPYAGAVLRFSHDGEHVIWESSYAAYPYDVAVDRRRGRVWVPDALDASVLCLGLRDGRFLLRARGFWRPWRMDVVPTTGEALVADWLRGQVVKLDLEGGRVWADARAEQPVDVASSVSGGYWVLDYRRKTVVHYSGPSAKADRTCPFKLHDPRAIDVDAKGMNLWLADATALYHYDYRENAWRKVLGGLTSVRAIDSEPSGERCWLLDGSPGGNLSSRAIRVHRNGSVEVESRGWGGASDIAWDWYTGGCAIVDPTAHELVKLDGQGRVVSRYSQMYAPTYVEIE